MRKVVDESGKVFEAEFRCSEPQLTPAGGMRSEEGISVGGGGLGRGLHHPDSTVGLSLGSEVASCSRSAFRYRDSSKGLVLEPGDRVGALHQPESTNGLNPPAEARECCRSGSRYRDSSKRPVLELRDWVGASSSRTRLLVRTCLPRWRIPAEVVFTAANERWSSAGAGELGPGFHQLELTLGLNLPAEVPTRR